MNDQKSRTTGSECRSFDPQSSILESRSSALAAPVAIIGMGCMFPKAGNLERYWANIENGVDAITEVPPSHWRPEDYFDQDPKAPDRTYAARGGFLSPVDFPPLDFGISPNSLEAIDTTQLLGLMVAREALEDAGYGGDRDFDRNRVSVILGVTGTLELVIPLGARLGHPIWRRALRAAGVEEAVAQQVIQRISDSYVGWQEDSFPGLLGNVVAGRIANRLDLGGTNCVVDAACASSLSALHLAVLELASGRCDMVLTGGLDTFNDIFMYMCFSKTPALSPTGNARPFDEKADGTILGEGLGILVLKRLNDAEHDGDKIYAVIKGIGSSSDGKGQAIYAPRPGGQAKALRQAFQLANVTPDTIELVEAHGTGTRAGDAAELTALTDVFHESTRRHPGQPLSSTPWCALGSVKSQIGHTKAAAGVAGLIKATLALHHKVLPPTIKVDRPVASLSQSQSPFYINKEQRPWQAANHHPRRAGVSSFGFGGSNFHCVLEEYQTQKTRVTWDGGVQILAFSAETREELEAALTAWPPSLSAEDLRQEAARSRACFRAEHACRLALVLEDEKTEVDRLLRNARSMLAKYPDKQSWSTPAGIYFGAGTVPGKLALLFPGQGSQYVGMFRDLACQFPQMQEALIEADAAWLVRDDPGRASLLASRLGRSLALPGRESMPPLSDFIYPHSTFCEEDERRNEESLRATEIAQPAIGAVSLGALRILDYFGVRPDAVAGHSYGELVALCAAGRFDSRALHALSVLRGALMASGLPEADRGAMLALRASQETVSQILAEEKLDLVVANKNAPNQFVLSGRSAEISRAEEVLARRARECRRLPVSAAFHSSLVAEVRHAFLARLEEVEFSSEAIPVFSNATGREYPNHPQEAQELLARQLAQPVEFIEEVRAMYQTGIRTFVEVGPSNTLSGLVGAILRDQQHQMLAVDSSSGKHPGVYDLARVLAPLAVWGYPVLLSRWDEAGGQASRKKKPSLTIPICGANYVKRKSEAENDPGCHACVAQEGLAESANISATLESMPPNIDRVGTKRNGDDRMFRSQQTDCGGGSIPSAKQPLPATNQNSELAGYLRTTQENLLALQKLGEQTAQLHRLFLEGQDRTLQAFQTLLQQQQQLMGASLGSSSPSNAGGSPSFDTGGLSKRERIEIPAPASIAGSSVGPNLKNGQAQSILFEVVSEKTGYPTEMLEMNMELDSDLGIDSIKRVEIFSALQERLPGAPQVKSEHLGSLRTLRQIVDFLSSPGDRRAEDLNSLVAEVNRTEPQNSPPEETTEKILLEVVAEKTGYPAEMLELDMELDSDLGIDSIKRVEIFSALQEKLPQAPAVKSEHLGALKTLRQIVQFLSPQTPSELPAVQNGSLPLDRPTSNGQPRSQEDKETGRQGDREKDGQAAVSLSPCLPVSLSSSSGKLVGLREIRRYVLTSAPLEKDARRRPIEIAKGGEIWITKDDSSLTGSLASLLNARGHRTRLVDIQNLTALPKTSWLAGLIILTPAGENGDAFLKQAFQLLQIAGPALRQSGKTGGSLFATVSRIDGSFGLGSLFGNQSPGQNKGNGSFGDPISGGLAGLAKTAAKEWPEVQCKGLDIAADWDDAGAAAAAIVDEVLAAGPLEVGISSTGKCCLQLEETGLPSANPHPPFTKEDVFILSGGARGITAEVAVALARAFSPTLVLLGRSPEPKPEPDWLAKLTEEGQIKRALLAQADGKKSPKEIEEQYRLLTAQREISRNIRRIENAGAKAIYRCVDVRHAELLRGIVTEIRTRFGPIRGLIHGAGIIADRRIEDKTLEQFERVYATKVHGLRNLLHSLEDDLKVLVLFSSSSGRFGRAGQVDYAMANEVLNKFAQQEARRRPGCRVLSLNWGPWEGGMVTSSLQKAFESEGLGLIPLEAGAEYLVREISQDSDRAVEIIVLGAKHSIEGLTEGNGTIDGKKAVTTNQTSLTLAFEQELDVQRFPFLRSHVIDGHAVLPVTMSLEWLAHGALHGNPGLMFHGCDNLRIFKGVILKGDEPYRLRVFAGKAMKEGSHYRVPVEMRSVPHRNQRGQSQDREVLHSRADIILAEQFLDAGQEVPEIVTHRYLREKEEIYDAILFHGPDFQGIERIDGCSDQGITGQVSVAPAPSAWIHRPLRGSWLADPLALDSAFQMMVLWSFENRSSCSLPCFVGRYRQYRRSFPREAVRVTAAVKEATTQRAVADIVFQDSAGQVVARLEDYECVIDANLNEAFRRKELRHEMIPTT